MYLYSSWRHCPVWVCPGPPQDYPDPLVCNDITLPVFQFWRHCPVWGSPGPLQDYREPLVCNDITLPVFQFWRHCPVWGSPGPLQDYREPLVCNDITLPVFQFWRHCPVCVCPGPLQDYPEPLVCNDITLPVFQFWRHCPVWVCPSPLQDYREPLVCIDIPGSLGLSTASELHPVNNVMCFSFFSWILSPCKIISLNSGWANQVGQPEISFRNHLAIFSSSTWYSWRSLEWGSNLATRNQPNLDNSYQLYMSFSTFKFILYCDPNHCHDFLVQISHKEKLSKHIPTAFCFFCVKFHALPPSLWR